MGERNDEQKGWDKIQGHSHRFGNCTIFKAPSNPNYSMITALIFNLLFCGYEVYLWGELTQIIERPVPVDCDSLESLYVTEDESRDCYFCSAPRSSIYVHISAPIHCRCYVCSRDTHPFSLFFFFCFYFFFQLTDLHRSQKSITESKAL